MAKKKAVRKRSVVKSNGHAVVNDGTIPLKVSGGKYDGQEFSMDAMVVKLAAEPLERKHKLQTADGKMYPTGAFAVELSAELEKCGYSSTPAIAVNAWAAACEFFAKAQKKTRQSRS